MRNGNRISLTRRIGMLAGMLTVMAANPSLAGVVSWAHSDIPTGINIVGHAGGVPDPVGTFTVVLRDNNNIPQEDRMVRLYFTNCSDIRLCENQLDEDVTLVCTSSSRYVQKQTNASGEATFTVLGTTSSTGGSGGGGQYCAFFYSIDTDPHSATITLQNVAVLDHDGNGMGSTDLSLWMADYWNYSDYQVYVARSDYDFDGDIDSVDLSAWAGHFFAAGSVEGCEQTPSPSASCP